MRSRYCTEIPIVILSEVCFAAENHLFSLRFKLTELMM